jgi:transposase-like protein
VSSLTNVNSKYKKTLDEFLKLVNSLNDNEKNLVISDINKKITPFKEDGTKKDSPKKASSSFANTDIKIPINVNNREEIICPDCGSSSIVKNGTFDNKQRYRCKSCGKTFTTTTGSIRHISKSSEKTWDRVLNGMIEDHTNSEISEDCSISPSTVHIYRHKVMRQILTYMKGQSLTGIVEADEFYNLPNFKGSKNHEFCFGKETREVNNIPDYKRYGLKSNTEIRSIKMQRGLSRDKVCYSTAISHDNSFCGKPVNWGNISFKDIQSTLLKSLTPKAIFVGDRSKTNQNFINTYGFENHLLVPDGEARYGELYNLQKINNFHSKMKNRIRSNRSFATKYAEEYMAWFAWLLQIKDKTKTEKIAILKDMVEIGSQTATWNDIKSTEFPRELRKNLI